jgi:hypothetical protein
MLNTTSSAIAQAEGAASEVIGPQAVPIVLQVNGAARAAGRTANDVG